MTTASGSSRSEALLFWDDTVSLRQVTSCVLAWAAPASAAGAPPPPARWKSRPVVSTRLVMSSSSALRWPNAALIALCVSLNLDRARVTDARSAVPGAATWSAS